LSAENKQLVTAADQKIAPQYYNPQTDQYEHLRGKNGASNVNVIESALPTGAATAAKQDEQTAQLEALNAQVATDGKLDLILSKLSDMETELEAIKGSDGIKRIDETVDVQLTGSIVEDDRLRVAQKDIYDLTQMITLMQNTADGTMISDLVKATYGRTMLLLSPYSDNILWTRSAPSAAFWGVSSWTRTSGTKIVTPSTTTGPTESGVCTRVKIGTGGIATTADYSFDLDFTTIKALSIYTKLEEFGFVGSQILIYIGNTQIYSSGSVTSAREHDWTKRTFDVSSITGVQTFRLSVGAFYTDSEPRYSFGNLVLEVE